MTPKRWPSQLDAREKTIGFSAHSHQALRQAKLNHGRAPYFAREVVENALKLQAQNYEFLLWMAELERRNTSDASHQLSTPPSIGLRKTIRSPPTARPSYKDLKGGRTQRISQHTGISEQVFWS
tara:strand:- start:71 stop:442 length:372 start_codon:yes stop_codon:yes gene_type:complete